jgi:hypothetical protein
MRLSADKVPSLQHGQLSRIDLSARVPSSDPGGWHFMLYAQLPAAEFEGDFCGDDEQLNALMLEAAGSDLQFLLLNIDLCPAWAPIVQKKPVRNRAAQRVQLMLFTREEFRIHPWIHSGFEEAVEACLRDWELQLRERFSW